MLIVLGFVKHVLPDAWNRCVEAFRHMAFGISLRAAKFKPIWARKTKRPVTPARPLWRPMQGPGLSGLLDGQPIDFGDRLTVAAIAVSPIVAIEA